MSYNLSLKSKTYPELKEFFTICANADDPNVELRNTYPLYTILKRTLSINLRLLGHYQTRSCAISSFGWKIQNKTDKKEPQPDVLKRLKPAIEKIIENQLRTVFYGSLLIEFETQSSNAGQCLKVKKVFENTDYDYSDSNIYLLNSQDKYATGKRSYKTIPINDTVDYLFDKADIFPERGGLLRPITIMEILRYSMLLENANFLKKLKGILQIINKGGSPEDQKAAETAATTAVRNNYVVTGDGIEFKLNEITAAVGGAFKEFTGDVKSDIAIAVLGQANTTELPTNGGSRAALQVMQMISADIFYSDMTRVEKLMDKLLHIDYRLNFSPNATSADVPYEFKITISEEQDTEKNANVLSIITPFMPILKDEAYASVGFTPPKEDDEVFQGMVSSTPQDT